MHTIGKCGGFSSTVCDAVLCGQCTIQIVLFYIILYSITPQKILTNSHRNFSIVKLFDTHDHIVLL